jgi:hypothetical protein
MTIYNGDNNGNLDKLRRMYSNTDVARAAFDYFAACKNNKRSTTVGRLQQVIQARGTRASYGEVKEYLRELARLGCGRYVIGRRGHPSRMEWGVGLVSLGQAAAGHRLQIEKFVEETGGEQDSDETETVIEQPSDMKVSYPLRHDRNVELILPKNLSMREAHRLAEFIKTLPFDEVGEAA